MYLREPHLCLQEAAQCPLLLDALPADIHGHTECKDDNDEEATDDTGRNQWRPAQRRRKTKYHCLRKFSEKGWSVNDSAKAVLFNFSI